MSAIVSKRRANGGQEKRGSESRVKSTPKEEGWRRHWSRPDAGLVKPELWVNFSPKARKICALHKIIVVFRIIF
ncbi:MAG: hypothetical protein LBU53_01700 [Zoogloeaceae bacterium]|jgi:hypothetical protein|nr:hypothetical protein [Zoogloeaceae bacterium]